MLESLRPSTLLLAAICAWSLAVLGLTVGGLGGRNAAVTADGAARPLPAVKLSASKSRLGPLADYAQIGARPLLMPGRKPQPIAAAPGEAGESDLNARLTSVMITPTLQMAILTLDEGGLSRRVRVGENVEGTNWHLTALEPRRAVFDGPSGQKVLDLRVYDGKGGVAPTVLAQAALNNGGGTATASDNGGDVNADNSVNTPLGPVPGSPIGASRPARAEPREPSTPAAQPQPQPQAERPMSQQEQVEAIRRRIEARRAQMRAQPPVGDSQ